MVESVSRMCIRAHVLHASVHGALFRKNCFTFVVLSGSLFRHSFYGGKWESAHFRLESKRVEASRRQSRMCISAHVLLAFVHNTLFRKDGRGLLELAKDLRSRCEEVLQRKGERIPK